MIFQCGRRDLHVIAAHRSLLMRFSLRPQTVSPSERSGGRRSSSRWARRSGATCWSAGRSGGRCRWLSSPWCRRCSGLENQQWSEHGTVVNEVEGIINYDKQGGHSTGSLTKVLMMPDLLLLKCTNVILSKVGIQILPFGLFSQYSE